MITTTTTTNNNNNNNKFEYFQSSERVPDFKRTNDLANKIVEMWIDNDDDELKLLDYPKNLKDYKNKTRRHFIEQNFNSKLGKLYKKNIRILNLKPKMMTSNSLQNKYNFTDEFKKIIIKGIEVNCRMITTNILSSGSSSSLSSSSFSYNLTRIANITFKGNMHNIINNLLEKCKIELQKIYCESVNEIKSIAMYVPLHNDSLCCWPCSQIEANIKKRDKYKVFFKSSNNNNNNNNNNDNNYYSIFDHSNKPLCYNTRQIIGQEIIPYVDNNDDDNDDNNNNDNDNDNSDDDDNDEEYVFDNLFYKDELYGIK